MKLKQNAPLRLKITNTPTLLKPYSDKDTRIFIPTKTFEHQLTIPKSDYPILIPSNACKQNNKNTCNKIKIYDEEKKEEKVIYNDRSLNKFEKQAKNKENIINASESKTESSLKNIVKNICNYYKIIKKERKGFLN